MIFKILKRGLLSIVIILGFLFTILIIQNEVIAYRFKNTATPSMLGKADLNELNEVTRLKEDIGDEVWPGFKDEEIPIIFFNEQYEFLYTNENQLNDFKPIDSSLDNQLYRRIAINPQAFAVNVNGNWVGSIGTLRSMNKEYFLGVRSELPPIIKNLFPYQMANIKRDMHVSTVFHEQFHAYQAINSKEKFEHVNEFDYGTYPINQGSNNKLWSKEGYYLYKALYADTKEETKSYVRRFIQQRDERRQTNLLSEENILFEKEFEWLEGTAKYVEIRSYELASKTTSPYGFDYNDADRNWNMEIKRLKHDLGELDDYRFYLSGLAQARLLDKLDCNWKNEVMNPDTNLEDLLRDTVID